jgi:hypothetical protein
MRGTGTPYARCLSRDEAVLLERASLYSCYRWSHGEALFLINAGANIHLKDLMRRTPEDFALKIKSLTLSARKRAMGRNEVSSIFHYTLIIRVVIHLRTNRSTAVQIVSPLSQAIYSHHGSAPADYNRVGTGFRKLSNCGRNT